MKNTNLYEHDIAIRHQKFFGDEWLVGVDEAGRGPLAGPVVAAAVVLDLDNPIDGINDSKKLSEKQRDNLYKKIIANAKAYGVGIASSSEIDELNILQATFLAMRRAVEIINDPCGQHSQHNQHDQHRQHNQHNQQDQHDQYDLLLVDGNHYIAGLSKDKQMPLVGGDGKSASIAAASILAKVTRDRMMIEYHEKYPQYNFAKHKGYGTKLHRELIGQYGLCEIHRKSFCGNFL